MSGPTIEWDDRDFQDAVSRIVANGTNPMPLMAEISWALWQSTMDRFDTGTDPKGAPWAALAPATVARKTRLGYPPNPLVQRGDLKGSLYPDYGPDFAGVSTGLVYAPLHQAGGSDDMPPGPAAVPARPFLGVSTDDEAEIRDAAMEFLIGLIRA